MTPRIAVFMGTRPEGIKLAPVINALCDAGDIEPIVISTGQHQQMLQQVIEMFDLPIHHDLAVMRPNQTLASLSARLMTGIDEVLEEVKPDMALVQGDTTTVLMAALACFYRRIPLGHVEAGLRTGDKWSPFPEEINRMLASPLAALHFAPTDTARRNLVNEGIDDSTITVTGNTVIDALHMELKRQKSSVIQSEIDVEMKQRLGSDWSKHPFILITGHRRENFGGGFVNICEAIRILARKFTGYRFIYPVHLNPNVCEPVHERIGNLDNVKLIEPLDYRLFVHLMSQSRLVLTDSGGVQEEAPSLGKPVLVMRDTTERPEGVDAGTVLLTGPNTDQIVHHVARLLTDDQAYQSMAETANPYGDGNASRRIIECIRSFLDVQSQLSDAA